MPHQPFLPCVYSLHAPPLHAPPSHMHAPPCCTLVIGVAGQVGGGRRASTRKTRRSSVEVSTAPTTCMCRCESVVMCRCESVVIVVASSCCAVCRPPSIFSSSLYISQPLSLILSVSQPLSLVLCLSPSVSRPLSFVLCLIPILGPSVSLSHLQTNVRFLSSCRREWTEPFEG
jgi:hypothetical protein